MKNTINQSNTIEDLIIRGINLMRLIEPAIDTYGDSNVDMSDVRQKYNIWRIDIKDEIQRNNIDQVAASYFWQPDGVPLIDGGIEYSNFRSERSQEMLKNIYKQIGIKIGKLRKVAKMINNTKQEKKSLSSIKIRFDEKSSLIFFDEEKYKIEPGSKEFVICKFMFTKEVGEFCSWDEPFSDKELELNTKGKKMAADAVRRINQKIQEIVPTNDKFLSWKNMNISRLF